MREATVYTKKVRALMCVFREFNSCGVDLSPVCLVLLAENHVVGMGGNEILLGSIRCRNMYDNFLLLFCTHSGSP